VRDALFPFFQWSEALSIAGYLRTSIWAFPFVQAVHLLSLCILAGAVLIVDLRLLGFGIRHQPIPTVIRLARPWLVAGVALMVTTGYLMFSANAAARYFINDSFWLKMTVLPLAILFTFGARAVLARKEGVETSLGTRLAGALSIALWLTVTAAGRWIGFS
jgi:hypothetical protein